MQFCILPAIVAMEMEEIVDGAQHECHATQRTLQTIRTAILLHARLASRHVLETCRTERRVDLVTRARAATQEGTVATEVEGT